MKTFFVAFVLSFLLSSAYSQSVNTANLDSLFERLKTNNKFMGSMAMSADGKIIYSNAIG